MNAGRIPHTMKRKIVQHGSSSLTLTLPSKWAKKFGLKKGDELGVEESGPSLIISTEQQTSSPRKEVSVTEYGIFTKNNLSHLYQLGYDEVDIQFNDSRTLEEIKDRIPRCMGFEIIDQKSNSVHIKSIAMTLESEFDILLRKAFLITNEMASEMIAAIEENDFTKLKEIRSMEGLNNKFTDICTRILNKRGYKRANRTLQMHYVVKNLERIADEFKYLCDALASHKGPLSKKNQNMFQEAVDYYLAFYAMFYKFEPKLKRRIYEDRKQLLKNYTQALKQYKGTDSLFMHHLISIVSKTYDAAGAYFALML